MTRLDGSAGGSATGSATVESAGVAIANAKAVGGSGGDGAGPGSVGGAAGTGSVSAHAIGSESASASVILARGGGGSGEAAAAPGADVSLVNVPVAESPGSILLYQSASGGEGGYGPGSRGGNASSQLTSTRTSGTGLELNAYAQGGNASSDSVSPGGEAHGGNAAVFTEGRATGAQAVTVNAAADAGHAYGPDSVGGQAQLLSVLGESDSGNVDVGGSARAGFGDHAQAVDLVNAVRGSTSGNLSLYQYAAGGSSMLNGADGRSILTRDAAALSQSLAAYAEGGGSSSQTGATGGDAWAETQSRNTAGGSQAVANSSGGSALAGVGGAAVTWSTSESLGVGHDSASEGYSYGGSGGNYFLSLDGRGGSATTYSRSYLNGPGGSSTAHAEATGGSGRQMVPGSLAVGGYGNADARAFALFGIETPEVRAVAKAAGGEGNAPPFFDPYNPPNHGLPSLLGTGDAPRARAE